MPSPPDADAPGAEVPGAGAPGATAPARDALIDPPPDTDADPVPVCAHAEVPSASSEVAAIAAITRQTLPGGEGVTSDPLSALVAVRTCARNTF